MSNRISRRRFLHQTAITGVAGGVGLMISPAYAQARGANGKLNIGCVGVGGRGAANVGGVLSENIVALCDVDTRSLAQWDKDLPKAKRYRDFRRMLERKDLDAVVVSTPDHMHAHPSVHAMRAGKHCYCEKPLAHSVWEIRMMIEAARKHKLATQMGTQIHAGDNYRRVVELVQAGAIGPVTECHVWIGGSYPPMNRPTDRPPVPKHLDWDLWVGPAPMRPYHPAYAPFKWRNWWDFGSGMLGDFGCHYQDLAFWALKLRHPLTVHATGPKAHPEVALTGLTVTYKHPARGKLPPVTLTWYDGPARPTLFKEKKIPQWGAAVLFIGSKGMLISDYGKHQLLPEDKFKGFQPPRPFIAKSIGHHSEWIDACKTGSPTTCNFDYSGTLAEAIALGNASHRCGERLEWDWKALKATNTPKAARFIRRKYRKGWDL